MEKCGYRLFIFLILLTSLGLNKQATGDSLASFSDPFSEGAIKNTITTPELLAVSVLCTSWNHNSRYLVFLP